MRMISTLTLIWLYGCDLWYVIRKSPNIRKSQNLENISSSLSIWSTTLVIKLMTFDLPFSTTLHFTFNIDQTKGNSLLGVDMDDFVELKSIA